MRRHAVNDVVCERIQIFDELRIQFIRRESDILMALHALLSDHSAMTLRMSYAEMSHCEPKDVLQIAGAVVSGGSVFIEK